ncbi:Hypothetical_protein [Hexamita inflata]|uniref:Hypothetical_protein n=1 Tax=Hexamita inflata TaxID=28002 RepID=A0AA86TZU4_9EUKA|nr:Hypothetical protein HINF_LOCUS20852 [Hexamita inflata]
MQQENNSCEIIKEIIKLCSQTLIYPLYRVLTTKIESFSPLVQKYGIFVLLYMGTRNSKGLEKTKLNFFLCRALQQTLNDLSIIYNSIKSKTRNIITIQLIAYQIWKDGTCVAAEAENKRGRDRAVASVVLFQNLMVLGLFKVTAKDFQFSF